ncbi:MAG: rRNA maturation RNase YbeY [Bacteroidota bacterium]
MPESVSASKLKQWIDVICQGEGGEIGELNYIFCGDEFILDVNRNYLNHDYYTDIITFPSDDFPVVSADIFISTDRVEENAKSYGVSYTEELRRVVIHGVLHLCGYGDKTDEEIEKMRFKENEALLKYDDGFKED